MRAYIHGAAKETLGEEGKYKKVPAHHGEKNYQHLGEVTKEERDL